MEGGGLHRERPRGGGESGAWQCSTELLLLEEDEDPKR
jgi:hypothetical protein